MLHNNFLPTTQSVRYAGNSKLIIPPLLSRMPAIFVNVIAVCLQQAANKNTLELCCRYCCFYRAHTTATLVIYDIEVGCRLEKIQF